MPTLKEIIFVLVAINGMFSGIWYFVVKWWSGFLRDELDRRSITLKKDLREMIEGKFEGLVENIKMRREHMDERLNRQRKDIDDVIKDCKECRKRGGEG